MKPTKQFTVTSIVILAAGLAVVLSLPRPEAVNFDLVKHKVQPKITTLFFAGDIMLSRNVAASMYRTRDFTLPFAKVKDEIATADIAFANLESPFNDSGDHSVEGSLVFNADPKSIEGLKNAGFDILSTANNHSFDQGKIGINYTKTWVSQNGIIPIGTGPDCHDGVNTSRNQITFGFLAYSYTAYNSNSNVPDPLVCDAYNFKQLENDIRNLKLKSDVVIVSLHAGTEYTLTPNEFQINFVDTAIASGADIIIGAHPHWIQKPIENRNGKWIFYSLGNFVFDQMWSTETRQGLTVKITYKDKILDKIELKPVIIDDYCCPRWADENETKSILNKINLTSTVLFQHN